MFSNLPATNPVIWAIMLLGLGCYILLINFLLSPRDPDWIKNLKAWVKVLPILLSTLPLLGLLGTIVGLISTFDQMADGAGALDQQIFLSSGIADALITTQLGLVVVIPGWLLLAYLKSEYKKLSVVYEK